MPTNMTIFKSLENSSLRVQHWRR